MKTYISACQGYRWLAAILKAQKCLNEYTILSDNPVVFYSPIFYIQRNNNVEINIKYMILSDDPNCFLFSPTLTAIQLAAYRAVVVRLMSAHGG